MHSAILIDDFVKGEEAKMTRLDKFFRNYPQVSTTASMAGAFQNMALGSEKVIKPSVWDKAVALFFLFIAGMIWFGLLGMLLAYRSPFLVVLLFFLLVSFLIYYLVWVSFFSKRYIYTIIINSDGINIAYNLFVWTDILETCIMSRQEGRTTNHYLILFTRSKTIEQFDLFKFGISAGKLAAIIEYYKARSVSDN